MPVVNNIPLNEVRVLSSYVIDPSTSQNLSHQSSPEIKSVSKNKQILAQERCLLDDSNISTNALIDTDTMLFVN